MNFVAAQIDKSFLLLFFKKEVFFFQEKQQKTFVTLGWWR